jgi:hypothetical protein
MHHNSVCEHKQHNYALRYQEIASFVSNSPQKASSKHPNFTTALGLNCKTARRFAVQPTAEIILSDEFALRKANTDLPSA